MNPDFVYIADRESIDVEELWDYKPGGHHPIILGHIIHSPSGASSYRILHKLGHGAFSTVWLADHNRSDTTPTCVAVKVSTADGESANEADLLQSVPSSHIAPVFDSFELAGPNGRHHVIVTEVLCSFVDFLSIPCPIQTTKRLIWEIVKAVEQLHEAGLIHGDLHLRNVGVTLPQIQTMRITKLACALGGAVMIPVIPRDMTVSNTSVPAYITAPSTGLKYLYPKGDEDNLNFHAKLFDFGSVRKESDATKGFFCIRSSCSPELAYAIDVERRNPLSERPSDIWALGTLIFQIISGGELMFPRGVVFSKITTIAGDPPLHWDRSVLKPQPDTNTDTWWNSTRGYLRKHCESDADCDTLIRLLRRIFVLDAAARPSAAEILCDEWFALTDSWSITCLNGRSEAGAWIYSKQAPRSKGSPPLPLCCKPSPQTQAPHVTSLSTVNLLHSILETPPLLG